LPQKTTCEHNIPKKTIEDKKKNAFEENIASKTRTHIENLDLENFLSWLFLMEPAFV
jgi:hypothetical protein